MEGNFESLVSALSAEFDAECQARHKMGAEKYGPVKFLEPGNDLFRMTLEEIVDAANYLRYLYVRLGIIQDLHAGRLQVPQSTPLGPTGVVNPFKKES